MTPTSEVAESGTSSNFPSWTFTIPVDVANKGMQIAIYGQDPDTLDWMYWDQSSLSYVAFSSSESGQDTAPLIDATPQKGSYTAEVTFTINLLGTQFLKSGVVAMFIGGSTGIPVSSGIPASPTTATNPNDLYSLFEFTYILQGKPPVPTLDIDISNVDQVGFTYTVQSSSAPFPLAKVGSTVPQTTLFSQFGTAFPGGTPFNECLIYGEGTVNGSVEQLRLLAPQDVLQDIVVPNPPSFLQPTGTPQSPDPFTDNTYFYKVSESSASGETAPNPVGVFGGFLLSTSGTPQASGINVGWQSGGTPVAYTPMNPTATAINIYRASEPAANAGSPAPTPPDSGYGLLTSMSITAWNVQQGLVFLDKSTSVGAQTPKSSSYGFSPLSTWFDSPLQDFYKEYTANQFALYQFNQNNGPNGTLWTGKVVDVTPKVGDAITSMTYIDENGSANAIDTTWQWGDGTQTYRVLQLVGNAYDPSDYSKADISGESGLTEGEYQGAVVNIYFPYFTGNTGLTSIALSGGGTYTLPDAPSWLDNAVNGPSQMVFGCAGVFATPNDPDALAQQATYPVLALNALTNIQNVIVSGLNRGVATGYNFAVKPQQYTSLFNLSQAPTATPSTGAIPAGTYTYYLSGTLNDGSESALSWAQTIQLTEPSTVTLNWLPQSPSLYKQANVYRQLGSGEVELVGTVANSNSSQATTFTDTNQSPPAQPTSGAPFLFYPEWNNPSASGYLNSNLFSAFLHQNLSADVASGISINGLVYGYPFDDQGEFSTNINYGSDIPASITFQITTLS